MEQDLRLMEICKRVTRILGQEIVRQIQEIPELSNLTPSQIGIMDYLSEQPAPVSQKQIQDFFHLTNPTVTGLLKRMEKKGVIVRSQGEQDARVRLVELSPPYRKGHGGFCTVKMEDSIRKQALAGMAEEELKMLETLIGKILRNLEGESAPVPDGGVKGKT